MRIPRVALLVALLTGCTDEAAPAPASTEPSNLAPAAERIGMSLAALSIGAEDHRQAILQVTDVAALDRLEHEYHRATGRYIYHVWDELDRLQACRDIDRQPPNLQALTDLRDATYDELDRHRLAARAAPDVMTAWLEESRHQNAVRQLVASSLEGAQRLVDIAVGFSCGP